MARWYRHRGAPVPGNCLGHRYSAGRLSTLNEYRAEEAFSRDAAGAVNWEGYARRRNSGVLSVNPGCGDRSVL
jgi:hypothetical protein